MFEGLGVKRFRVSGFRVKFHGLGVYGYIGIHRVEPPPGNSDYKG